MENLIVDFFLQLDFFVLSDDLCKHWKLDEVLVEVSILFGNHLIKKLLHVVWEYGAINWQTVMLLCRYALDVRIDPVQVGLVNISWIKWKLHGGATDKTYFRHYYEWIRSYSKVIIPRT